MKFSETFMAAVMLAYASAAVIKFETPKASFMIQSENRNEWTGGATAGCIIGFATFGILYIYTVGMIFVDTKKRGEDFDE